MMSIENESEPETLLNQCFKFVARNLHTICYIDPCTNNYELGQGIALPREICEKFLQVYQQNGGTLDDRFVHIFRSPETSLKRVRLRNSNITDEGLAILLKHRLSELDIAKCKNVSQNSFHIMTHYADTMTSLIIGPGVQFFSEPIATPTILHYSNPLGFTMSPEYNIIQAPKLKRLAIRGLSINKENKMYLPHFLKALPNVMHLDLSGCTDFDLEDLTYITQMTNLVSLVLHNVMRIQEVLVAICKLHNLRHLDISQSHDKLRIFKHENKTLATIVESLPKLESLDISGTNLAGTGVAENYVGYKMARTDIPGLSSRVTRPFEFLGLYGTQHGACRRHDIPAKVISGDANEAQILTAAAAYIDRPDILQRVLNDLYHLFRYETCQNISRALSLVLDAMERHLTEKHIQISGSATLFYIVKNTDKPVLAGRTKRTIISTLLNGMNAHKEDDTLMRNGCLTLCQFKIPQDVIFEYERLVQMLLHIVSEMEQEGFVQRIGIYLLNSLACQVDGYQKQLLGDLGAINRMLSLIEDRLERKVCDDVLEVAWSTMWNVTDETAINCERFLDGRGMDFFLGCLDLFPDKEELMRNMMGLLGNVAEVKPLRPRLMTGLYITVFTDLVDSCNDGIEVGYNAAGVLSHMASDGAEAWTISEPKREHVLQCMINAIEHWNLGTERNINYRSFEPILQLAKVRHTPQCQHWAIWALANLTRVYPDKYCLLVEAEGGLRILEDVIHDDAPYARIKELAALVLNHCRQFRERGHVELQLDG